MNNTTLTTGFIGNISEAWIESMYNAWLTDKTSVPREWDSFFYGFRLGADRAGQDNLKFPFDSTVASKHSGVQSLIYRYRDIGHLIACTDPLSPCRLGHPQLELSIFGLTDTDLDTHFTTRRFFKQPATLREILETMRETYCREIGVEFMHIQDPDERQWLIERMEPCLNRPEVSPEEKLRILKKLHQAALFESFLHRRFPGQKRFSLEGGEVLIPVLDTIVQGCPGFGISDVVMGMSHRGRLNVLTHLFDKPYENIFAEFGDNLEPGFVGDGDVKYHKGSTAVIVFPDSRTLHLTLAANPSHLEAVNPVVEGKCRARQERYTPGGSRRVLPLLIHGDAAFGGQGSVMETLNMSRLDGYGTGGTVHLVLNNQIGFTTLPRDARSTRYATDVAKMLSCPVFHVQGEAPEAAVHAARLALEYRQTFGQDVVLELVCYRRYGHNEGDEPAFTQPGMYRLISERPTLNRIYSDSLRSEGIDATLLDEVEQSIIASLEESVTREPVVHSVGFKDQWSTLSQPFSTSPVETAVPAERLAGLAHRLAELPPGFQPHAKVDTLLQKRLESVQKGTGIDWGGAETLAYGTLLEEGFSVRLSGQDSRRGTFNHRHAVLHDIHNDQTHIPLTAVAADGATFQVWDSPLSEFGVLGFEYGYSLESPMSLTIWEAQFGDFANGAQVIIDQFIVSGETKWNRACGLVMLLPHGYEGQGGEHSSARIERYLQMCANDNMIVSTPTTPAQMFHLLRRQLKQPFRKPLIIFTPKSLLRNPVAVSALDDLAAGSFRECMLSVSNAADVHKVILCSGKIFHELAAERERLKREDVALVRIEQLYPLRIDLLSEIISSLPAAARSVWVQEEPENMGAAAFIRPLIAGICGDVPCISRSEDSCPAVGSHRLHNLEQASILTRAFE